METQPNISAPSFKVWRVTMEPLTIKGIAINYIFMWDRVICHCQKQGWVNTLNKVLETFKQQRCCKMLPIWSRGGASSNKD